MEYFFTQSYNKLSSVPVKPSLQGRNNNSKNNSMKLGVFALVSSVALAASGVEGLCDLSQCQSFSFRCGWDVFQGGMDLGLPTAASDSCDMGGGMYRPMVPEHFDVLKERLLALNSTTLDNAQNLKCRGYENSKGTGKGLNAFACYMADGTNYMWKKPKKNQVSSEMPTCEKKKQYFSSHEPHLKHWWGCDPDSTESTCEPGYICSKKTSGGNHMCMSDPMADHECCLSLGDKSGCSPGECCLGSRCVGGKECKEGWEPKNVVEFPGICSNHTVRKAGILQGNMCLMTPDIVNVDGSKSPVQGDCAEGLHCAGKHGYGFCKWWKKYEDACAMKRWKKGCTTGDCQEGTYCHYKYNSNGSMKFTQCQPKPYGFVGVPGDQNHDGLCTNPAHKRIYNKKLGKCVGVTGKVWGDPHVISYDNLKWNCQAQGDFVVTDNWLVKAQGRFDGMPGKGYKVSQSKAYSVKTGFHTPDDDSDDALFQIWFPEDYVHKDDLEDFDQEKFDRGFINDCPVAIRYNDGYVHLDQTNGVVTEGQLFIESAALTATVTKISKSGSGQSSGVFLTLDFATGVSAELRVHGGGSSAWNGCVMSIEICLPAVDDPEIDVPYNDTVGLLGYPDSKKSNDWMKKNNETHVTFLEVITSGKDKLQHQWDYCTKNWCIRDVEDSIMPYAEDGAVDLMNAQYYFDQCDKEFPGYLDMDFCKTIEPCKKHLQDGLTYDDYMAEGKEFPAAWDMCCIECMFGADVCEDEELIVEEIEETAVDPGVDGDPFNHEPEVVCTNMGSMLSGTSGATKFVGPQPPPECGDEAADCVGQDDSYGLFVGGHLHVMMAEDIEGRVYAGAGIKVDKPIDFDNSDEVDEEPAVSGEMAQLNGIGWATCGSHMCPSEMSRVLEVCGDINLNMPEGQKIDIMPLEGQTGTVVYTGKYMENGVEIDLTSETEVVTLLDTNGEVKPVDPAEVCGIKDALLTPLVAKSAWWATADFKDWVMGAQGEIEIMETSKVILLKQKVGTTGCPLIFDMDAGLLNKGDDTEGSRWKIIFDQSIGTNTVLINVRGTSVDIAGIGSMQEMVSCMEGEFCIPSEGYAFSTQLVTNLLWNFPEAEFIKFGMSAGICPFTWQGSILAPKASVTWHFSGHRGRFVVGGDMTIERADAIFLNYAFDPEACALPQPTDGTCVEITGKEVDECVVETYINTDTGKNVCPLATESIVFMAGEIGWPSETDDHSFMNGGGIIYGMKMVDDHSSVKFNVNVPMGTEADIYVKHEVFAEGSTWLEPTCEAVNSQNHCLKDTNMATEARQFEVACQAHTSEGGDISHRAVVYIYFATKDADVVAFQTTEKGATIDKCCYPKDYANAEDGPYGIVEYSFTIDCACPETAAEQIAERRLRG